MRWSGPRASSLLAVVAAAAATCLSCPAAGQDPAETPTTTTAESTVAPSPNPALLIGEGALGRVVDGDTLHVAGYSRALRLLAIDTEETPQGPYRHVDFEAEGFDWSAYVAAKAAASKLPVKFPTPAGVEATRFAKELLGQASLLRLERDRPGQGTGSYGRELCYVWLFFDDGRPPLLYNLEVVRAGHSPYFTKYGRSHRFDAAFRTAQAEARAAKRGIWDPEGHHYPDYERRLLWWERRADAQARYAQLARSEGAPIMLDSLDGIRQLLQRVGERVCVFGILDDHDPRAVVRHDDGATLRVGGLRYYIEIEIQGQELADTLRVERLHGEYVLVRGALDQEGSPLIFGRRKDQRFMRIPVTSVKQLVRGDRIPVPEDEVGEAVGALGVTD